MLGSSPGHDNISKFVSANIYEAKPSNSSKAFNLLLDNVGKSIESDGLAYSPNVKNQ